MNPTSLDTGDKVLHSSFGPGTVQICQGALAIIEFESGLERVPIADLLRWESPHQVQGRQQWDPPLGTILRLQGQAIRSINDAWGVFSPSHIDLLPHQLWVCKKVNSTWPTRWLVADDVGLGKTVEAGLILWPLVARGLARRVLILTPAGLVEQWRDRMYSMFDLRLQIYRPEEDHSKSNFWQREDQVVASFHTLRLDRNGRHKRLMEAPPWDLILVDEAHHLNHDEHLGPTRAYQLIQRLQEAGQVQSMVFFTGTPHRGKDYGFLALLQLLRPDLFQAKAPVGSQLQHLSSVVLRNNKYSVTDLKGRRLFQAPFVRRLDYEYTEDEQNFYDLISEFIELGFTYSSKMTDTTMGNAVGLVLIAIQKLAASSVAAVLRALKKRLAAQEGRRESSQKLLKQIEILREAEEQNSDLLAVLEEELASRTIELQLLEDEVPHLQELVQAAERVKSETKIETILAYLQNEFYERQVLIFTEYKATQSLLLTRLKQTFGDECCAFINGEERADDVIDSKGQKKSCTMTRQQAAEDFNTGQVRYLVATEAAGEGIDLQERCWTLIHADMPWNPMRMHQRVGRLNRYGQTRQVEVIVLSNLATVESRIFDRLMEKIGNITRAFDEVMEEPEDLFQFVLGLTRPGLFSELYSEGRRKFAQAPDEQSLSRWFDARASQFGGKDVVEVVSNLFGNCARFNYHEVSNAVPRVDLADLQPYFEAVLTLHHRRLSRDTTGLSFVTPEAWKQQRALLPRYQGIHFDRNQRDRQSTILGVGHRLMQIALEETRTMPTSLSHVRRSPQEGHLFVFEIRDAITANQSTVRVQVAGVLQRNGNCILVRDWEILKLLNQLLQKTEPNREPIPPGADATEVEESQRKAAAFLESHLGQLALSFQVPQLELLGTLW